MIGGGGGAPSALGAAVTVGVDAAGERLGTEPSAPGRPVVEGWA